MMLIDCGSAEEARANVDDYVRDASSAGLEVSRGRFRDVRGGGRYGGHTWHTNFMIVVLRGGGVAVDGQGEEIAVKPGQGVFWSAGDWFAFEIGEGAETEALTLQGADLDPRPGSCSTRCEA